MDHSDRMISCVYGCSYSTPVPTCKIKHNTSEIGISTDIRKSKMVLFLMLIGLWAFPLRAH